MNFRLPDNSYIKALKENENFNNELKIFSEVNKKQQFKYGDVSRQKFNEKYSGEGWVGRKIIALPAAVLTVVIKTICHLARALLIGVLKSCADDGKYLKAQFFYIARDFQESYGRFTSLFNDRYGLFHIQESQFQKMCYDNSTPWNNPAKASHLDESWHYSPSFTNSEKQSLLSNKKLSQLSAYEIQDLFPWSSDDTADRRKFARYEIADVQAALEDRLITSHYIFQLFSDEQLQGLKLSKLSSSIIDDLIGYGEEAKRRFANFGITEVQAALEANLIKKNSPLELFSDEQMRGLKLSKLSKDLIEDIFPWYSLTHEDKRKFALIDPSEVQAALEARLITRNSLLKLLSDKQLESLKLSKIPRDIIGELFQCYSITDEDKERFAKLDATEVQAALEAGLILENNILKLLSNEHLNGIKLSRLSKGVINGLFSDRFSNIEDRRRFANIEPAEVQKALNSNKLDKSKIQLISIDQINEFDFSTLSQEAFEKLFPPYSFNKLQSKKKYRFAMTSEILHASREQKRKNEDLLAQLSSKQRLVLEAYFRKNEEKYPPKESKQEQDSYSTAHSSQGNSSTHFKQGNRTNPSSFFGNSEPDPYASFFNSNWEKNFFNSYNPFEGFFGTGFGTGGTSQSHGNTPFSSSSNPNKHYETLGLKAGASVDDIKKAYRRLALKHHPDKIKKEENENELDYQKRKESNENQFKNISTAYGELQTALNFS